MERTNNTESAGKKVVQLDQSDALRAREQAAVVGQWLATLGDEVARHENARKAIFEKIDEAQREMTTLVRTLSKKYVKDAGQWDFRPEIGAFIGVAPPEVTP